MARTRTALTTAGLLLIGTAGSVFAQQTPSGASGSDTDAETSSQLEQVTVTAPTVTGASLSGSVVTQSDISAFNRNSQVGVNNLADDNYAIEDDYNGAGAAIFRQHTGPPLKRGSQVMGSSRMSWIVPIALVLSIGAIPSARADCKDFKWDVHQERALFASPPHALRAGDTPGSAAQLQTDRFYLLQLTPQQRVQFERPPGKTMLTDGDYAGVVKFTVPQAGSYRVSLDHPFWIDVIDDGKLLPTQDFQGQRGCSGPHKIVEFVLPAHRQLWLQFSGASAAQVQVSITRAPTAATGSR